MLISPLNSVVMRIKKRLKTTISTFRRGHVIFLIQACRDSSQRQDESSHKPDISTPDNDGLDGMFDLAEPTVWLCLQCGNQVRLFYLENKGDFV